ncbi:MAG: hypothetical protein RLY31_99 [Bacteroidota bacterium]
MHTERNWICTTADWQTEAADRMAAYGSHRTAYVHGLLPALAMDLSTGRLIALLQQRLGADTVRRCLDPDQPFPSPVAGRPDSRWLRRANMVGVNIRTVRHAWNLVKYCLTLPSTLDAIHLLPIWEPGVVGSLYGIASWHINPEFFSHELHSAFPHLDTVERQLKVTIHFLHAMGKTVGMDVIPHTDRYSEIVLANPGFFEWLRRDGTRITDHSNELHWQAAAAIHDFLRTQGCRSFAELPPDPEMFFSPDYPEEQRLLSLFGEPADHLGRRHRRARLIDHLYGLGLEPVPATMAPPYRGLETDPDSVTTDDQGRTWVDYRITEPTAMSRVFGPLTRFKFYENKDDNRYWEIDFERPRTAVWEYFCERYAGCARNFGFDFMRGDMSHVQMRPQGVPAFPDPWYDPLGAVKRSVQTENPAFGYFAESFLGPAGFLAYGDEVDHLEAAGADTTLGDLQSLVVGSPAFLQQFRWYIDIRQTRKVVPSLTLMTADKDDPRFDAFYIGGNETRLFLALFLPDMPSYMGLGFECRDPHPTPAPNEHYTKLFVFRIGDGPKATHGEFIWGRNAPLFHRLHRIHRMAESLLPELADEDTRWLLPPDPTGHKPVVAWTFCSHPQLFCVVNLRWESPVTEVCVPPPFAPASWELLFSTEADAPSHRLPDNGIHLPIGRLESGEARIYRGCPAT